MNRIERNGSTYYPAYTDSDLRVMQIVREQHELDPEFDTPRMHLGWQGALIITAISALLWWGIISGWLWVKGWM